MDHPRLYDMYYNTSEGCWFWNSGHSQYAIQPGQLLLLYIKRLSKTYVMLCEIQVDGENWFVKIGETTFILNPNSVYTLTGMEV